MPFPSAHIAPQAKIHGATLLSMIAAALLLAGCQGNPATSSSGGDTQARADGVISVPAEAATLTIAEALAEAGDVIQIAPGTYTEQLLITTPDITIRGEDRNTTIIDGEGVRPYGIVSMADGVTVENLTVTNATFYGLLFTGLHDESGPSAPTATGYQKWDPQEFPPLQRFLADHVTAINNGLYGIYAFNSQHGVIQHSYASGSADSGIYVGQCVECDILVTGNVAERNAVGFENSNASDSVVIAGNRFSNNRIGVTLLSSYQEAFLPQRSNTVVGNLISDNAAEFTPAQALGGFGTGVGISGGVGNVLARNTIDGHPRAGVLISNTEDLRAYGNAFIDNVFSNNRADVVNSSADRAPSSANCFSSSATTATPTITTVPESLSTELSAPDGSVACGPSLDEGVAQLAAADVGGAAAPPGISFRKVALPLAQPNLKNSNASAPLASAVAMPDLSSFTSPNTDFLADRVGSR